jgi:hypothetical protein
MLKLEVENKRVDSSNHVVLKIDNNETNRSILKDFRALVNNYTDYRLCLRARHSNRKSVEHRNADNDIRLQDAERFTVYFRISATTKKVFLTTDYYYKCFSNDFFTLNEKQGLIKNTIQSLLDIAQSQDRKKIDALLSKKALNFVESYTVENSSVLFNFARNFDVFKTLKQNRDKDYHWNMYSFDNYLNTVATFVQQ